MRKGRVESRKEGKRLLDNLELSCSELIWKVESSGNKRW